jgi:cation diffusion facilitator family transporter
VEIHYSQAIPVAILGLIVNLICAWLLHEGGHEHHHHHSHEHHHDDHHHPHDHHHHDLNQKAAFLHVVADAVTSVLAIIALFAAKYFSWNFLDALLGIIGALLVAKWSWGLMLETGKTLIDAEMGHPVVQEIKEVIAEFPQVEITDLHVWKVGKGKFSCILGLETAMSDLNPDQVKAALAIHEEIVHASVEIHHIE